MRHEDNDRREKNEIHLAELTSPGTIERGGVALPTNTSPGFALNISEDDVKKAFREVRARFSGQSEKQISARAASAGKWLNSLLNDKSGGAAEGAALHL